MNIKTLRKINGRFWGRIGIKFSSFVIRILPEDMIYAFATSFAKLAYCVAVRFRHIALQGLRVAFGNEKTQAEITQIARASIQEFAKNALELLYLTERPELLKTKVELQGLKHLDDALACGNGVIGVSAHFGNFPLILCKLSLEGYKVCALTRAMRDEKVEELFKKRRDNFDVTTIYSKPRKQCVDQSLRFLRKNELVFIPLDQNFGSGGIFVDFFGREAATATGPVVFALRTKAPILPMFIIRKPDNTHKVIFEPPIFITEKSADTQKLVKKYIQQVTKIIEHYIREYPQEWGWIHRRWKTTRKQKK
ncbi:lysophospholipid acyltransferase family protein [Candidatus Omnitrophota bacterium]